MKRNFLYLIILSLAVAPAQAKRFASGPVELEVYPAKAPEPAEKYSLVPKADTQTDEDAVPLYEKAIQAMAGGREREKQIQDWLAGLLPTGTKNYQTLKKLG